MMQKNAKPSTPKIVESYEEGFLQYPTAFPPPQRHDFLLPSTCHKAYLPFTMTIATILE